MSMFFGRLRRFSASEDGPTAVEYAVMLALILLACIAAVTAFGASLSSSYSQIGSTVGGAAS